MTWISLKSVPKGPMSNKPTLVQIMARCRIWSNDRLVYIYHTLGLWTELVTHHCCFSYDLARCRPQAIAVLITAQVVDAILRHYPDSKVRGANMEPIWGRQGPGGPHVGPMNFAIWVVIRCWIYAESANALRWYETIQAYYFEDDNFKRIFLNENYYILRISLMSVNGPINNTSTLVQVMAWPPAGDRPLPEPMMTCFTDALYASPGFSRQRKLE